MSIFSRECLLRHQSPFQTARALQLFFPRTSSQRSRFLTSTTILRAIKKARTSPSLKSSLHKNKPPFPPTKIPSPTTSPSTYQSYAATLAQKTHPILLYQAPSHTLFIISSYSAALFCFSYAGFSFWSHYLVPPEDLAVWVTYAFGGISFMMAGFGGWLLLGPARLIRTITAMPKSFTAESRSTAATVAKVLNPELQIEFELRKMFPLPFFPARKLFVKPDEVVLRQALAPPLPSKMSTEQLRAMRIEEERARKIQLDYERSHIMSAPFRHMNRAFFSMFKAMARTWSREGFLKVDVKGQSYKLDVTGGWALDSGRALDRLVVVKPKL